MAGPITSCTTRLANKLMVNMLTVQILGTSVCSCLARCAAGWTDGPSHGGVMIGLLWQTLVVAGAVFTSAHSGDCSNERGDLQQLREENARQSGEISRLRAQVTYLFLRNVGLLLWRSVTSCCSSQTCRTTTCRTTNSKRRPQLARQRR